MNQLNATLQLMLTATPSYFSRSWPTSSLQLSEFASTWFCLKVRCYSWFTFHAAACVHPHGLLCVSGGATIPVVPADATDAEANEVYEDGDPIAERVEDAANDSSSADGKTDRSEPINEADGSANDEANRGVKNEADELWMRNCTNNGALNGKYIRCSEYDDFMDVKRPVYVHDMPRQDTETEAEAKAEVTQVAAVVALIYGTRCNLCTLMIVYPTTHTSW